MACTDPIANQTRFLGASIQNYNASIGWGGSAGSCDITIVEDLCNTSKVEYDINGNVSIVTSSDMFNPPKIGSPVTFRFGIFSYTGILQSWTQNNKLDGKAYDIRLIDPSSILSGTQIILASYNGQTFGIPNLINAFAFIEYLYGNSAPLDPSLKALLDYTPIEKFGGADVNSAGINWNQVKIAIDIIANSGVNASFGRNLKFRDYEYYIDLSEVPFLERYFRLSGDSLSLLDIITQVCEYAGYDFFNELTYNNGKYYIRVRTVQRFTQPISAMKVDNAIGTTPNIRLNQGTISQFIGDGTGTVSNSRGLELRDEVTNCFMVGDYRSDMWQINYSGTTDGYTDTIWPYWGTNSYGYPILGNGVDDAHNFNLDTTEWGISGINGYYNITIQELRLASEGISSWETCLLTKHPELTNLQFCREVGTDWTNEEDFKQKAFAQAKLRALDIVDTSKTNVENMSKIDQEYKVIQLYNYIRNLATNYMGRKYMVALPYIASAVSQDEPLSLKLNFQPADSAWVDTTILDLAQDSLYLEKFRSDDGRIYGFVHFITDGDKMLDLAQIPQDSYVRISAYEAYVKCAVDEIVFLNPVTRTYPRAVITLPGMICLLPDDIAAGTAKQQFDAIQNPNATNPAANARTKNLQQPNMQNVPFSYGLQPIMPYGAAVPLQSTTLSYGPWVAYRNNIIFLAPAGQTRYIRETSLNPWTYGSTTMMNYAGHVLVDTQVTQQQVLELGNVEVAGAPVLVKIGNTLMAGGPEVTNIRVSVGINGLTTTYSFRTCTPNYGKVGEIKANALKMNGQWRNKIQRLFANAAIARIENPIVNSRNLVSNIMSRADRYSKQSAGTFLIAQNIEDPVSSGCYRTSIGLTDLRKCLPELAASSGSEYQLRAGMELGGLLRPFTTKSDSSHLSSFIDISKIKESQTSTTLTDIQKWNFTRFDSPYILPPVSGEGNPPICVTTLNPFLGSGYSSLGWLLGNSAGHDIEYIVRDGVYPTDLCIRHPQDNYSTENWYRAVALKGPLVIAGWGYDIYGKPVPNSGTNTAYFKNDWLRRPQDWKCGPVDLRWDESRGVWTSPPTPQLLQVEILDKIGDYYKCQLLNYQYGSCLKYGPDGNYINDPIITISSEYIAAISGMYGVVQYRPHDTLYDYSAIHPNYQQYELLWAHIPYFTVEPVNIIKTDNKWVTTTCRIKTATGFGHINNMVGTVYPCTDIPPISGYTYQAEIYSETGVIKLRQRQPYVQVLEPGQVDSMNTKVTLTRTSEEITWSSSSSIWAWTINNIPDDTYIALGYNYSTQEWFACGAQCYPSPVCGII